MVILSEISGRPRKRPNVHAGTEFSARQILEVKLWNHSRFASEFCTWLLQKCVMYLTGKADLWAKAVSLLLV